MSKILSSIPKVCLYLLVFLVPLFWLPFSFEFFEFNKQYLLLFLVLLACLANLAKQILLDRKIRFRTSPLDIFVGAFMLVAVLSAVFSADKASSLFGFYGRFSDGLISLLSLGLLYFLIANNIATGEKILKTFLWSAGLAVFMTYLSVFNVWQKMAFLPLAMRSKIFNPVAGSLESLAVFLAIILVLLVGQWKNWSIKQGGRWLLLAGILGLLAIINFWPAWLILLASLSLFVAFALFKRIFKESAGTLLLPLALIIVAVAGLSVNARLLDLPREQVLSQKTSAEVAFKTAFADVKSTFLGSGIGTWHYDFAKQKPASFNQTRFWQIRFERAGSYMLEMTATLGLLGVLAYLILIGAFLLVSWFRPPSPGLLLALTAAFIGQLVYYQNTVLAFSFWLLLALAAVSWPGSFGEKTVSFKKFPELNLIFNTILIVVSVVAAVLFYLGAMFYLADRAYAKSQYEKATKLNPYFPQYWTMLARDYLQKKDMAQAIEAGKQAVLRGPGEVAAFETLAMVYRDIRSQAAGAQDWAIKYFQEAIKLEPTNPVFRTELAKLLAQTSLTDAQAQIAEAEELKPDYLDAFLLEITLFEQSGNLEEAAKLSEKLAQSYPYNADVLSQLGRIYYNENRLDEAIAELESLLALFPSHSNALYTLGAAYQKKGQKDKARGYFERVLALNPGSEEVQKRLQELK